MRAHRLTPLVAVIIGLLAGSSSPAQTDLKDGAQQYDPTAVSSRRPAIAVKRAAANPTIQQIGNHANSPLWMDNRTEPKPATDITFVPMPDLSAFRPLTRRATPAGDRIGSYSSASRVIPAMTSAMPERDWSQIQLANQMQPSADIEVDPYLPLRFDNGPQESLPKSALAAGTTFDPGQCYDEWSGFCFFRSADGSTKCLGGTTCPHHCHHGELGSDHAGPRHRDRVADRRASRRQGCSCDQCAAESASTSILPNENWHETGSDCPQCGGCETPTSSCETRPPHTARRELRPFRHRGCASNCNCGCRD